MEEVGKYFVTLGRYAWICNKCRKPTFTNKIKHKCNSAPHWFGSKEKEVVLTKVQHDKLNNYLKRLI